PVYTPSHNDALPISVPQPFGGGRGGRHEARRRLARPGLGMVGVQPVEPRTTRHDREGAQAWGPDGTPTGIPHLRHLGGAVHQVSSPGVQPCSGTSIILTVARMKGLSPVPSTIWCWAMRTRFSMR